MKRESKWVAYSYEHGDKSLPHLKDLISDTPDPEKNKLIDYLETNCTMVRIAIVHDEICPDKIIGNGNIFHDGTYRWDDVFTNYVIRYNIPVPKEFRDHILSNYSARKKRHMQLRIVNCIEIRNNPYLGYEYCVRIYKNGVIKYHNNVDCIEEAVMLINPENAEWFIDPIMADLFCYDYDNCGSPAIDGYHWKIVFFRDEKVIDQKEGWEGEDCLRYKSFRSIIRFVEGRISKELGLTYME